MSTPTIARPEVDVGGWRMDHNPTMTVGARFLGPSGRILTLCEITPRGHRLIMMTPSVDANVERSWMSTPYSAWCRSTQGAGWPADTAPSTPQLSSPGICEHGATRLATARFQDEHRDVADTTVADYVDLGDEIEIVNRWRGHVPASIQDSRTSVSAQCARLYQSATAWRIAGHSSRTAASNLSNLQTVTWLRDVTHRVYEARLSQLSENRHFRRLTFPQGNSRSTSTGRGRVRGYFGHPACDKLAAAPRN